MDGSASGRWQATLSNWNGVAYKIPRGDLKDCGDLPELNTPGVYFLFGKDDETGKIDSGDDETPASDKKKTAVKPQPAPAVSADAEILHLAGKKVAATGRISGDGFIVMKDSGFSPNETNSCQTWIKKLRAQLVTDGKVKDCVFTEDVYFKSTSAAAACITGGSANGNIMWLYFDGQSIKDKTEKNN